MQISYNHRILHMKHNQLEDNLQNVNVAVQKDQLQRVVNNVEAKKNMLSTQNTNFSTENESLKSRIPQHKCEVSDLKSAAKIHHDELTKKNNLSDANSQLSYNHKIFSMKHNQLEGNLQNVKGTSFRGLSIF